MELPVDALFQFGPSDLSCVWNGCVNLEFVTITYKVLGKDGG